MNEPTIYAQVGGEPTFRRLVDVFYALVEADPLLRPLFPADLEPGKEHQRLFLIQYFGGPTSYNQLRGHPRLRMRHAPFSIGPAERDAWLNHMLAAIDEVGIADPARTTMREYFQNAAGAMMNRMLP
ncbi:MAG: globin [Oscillochloris sp.]|nr:globin [Oscillochloris sp.]